MFKKPASILFILCVFGLLVLNRFDFRQQVVVRVIRSLSQESISNRIGSTFKAGEIVHTGKGEFLELQMSDSIRIDLDENTDLELKTLSEKNIRVRFGHGRILVRVVGDVPIRIDTPTAQNILTEGNIATFVGYDFNRMTSVIPIVGSIQTEIPLLNQSFVVSSPINIHDVNPPMVEPTKFDRNAGAYKTFYDWAD